MSWGAGYVVDVDYTHGFYNELTPSFLNFFALFHGVKAPEKDAGPLTYCELGCGYGYTANILAAANPHIQFYANDFHPNHISGARALAKSAKLKNIRFYEDSFEEFLGRDDLPSFDYITLHGIYSWVSEENRKFIVEFIRKKLKLGGIVYISYNSMPGWAPVMPLRRLLGEYDQLQGTADGFLDRVTSSVQFAAKLKSIKALYFENNPKVGIRLEQFQSQSSRYLAHELFGTESKPFYFSDLMGEMSHAKLTWIGTANVYEAIDDLHLTEEQKDLLANIKNVAVRETLRDYLADQQFRRDIFIKGPTALSPTLAKQKWLDTRFIFLWREGDLPQSITGRNFKANFNLDIYTPLIEALRRGPCSLRQLMSDPSLSKFELKAVIELLKYMVALGICYPCLDQEGYDERKLSTDAFNEAIARKAYYGNGLGYVASPVLGSGIALEASNQMLWLAFHKEAKDPLGYAWGIMSQTGVRLRKGDQSLMTTDENLAELQAREAQFKKTVAPYLRSLGVLEPRQARQRKKFVIQAHETAKRLHEGAPS